MFHIVLLPFQYLFFLMNFAGSECNFIHSKQQYILEQYYLYEFIHTQTVVIVWCGSHQLT